MHGQPLSGPVALRSSGGSASRYPAGASVTLERVIGHRDTGRTACPGDALYEQLPEIRALVESGTTSFAPSSARVIASLSDLRVDYGELVPVNGALLWPDGAPLDGGVVELQVSTEDAWRTAKRMTAGPDGLFATELKPRKRMYVRVRYPGTSVLRGAISRRVLLRLHPVIEFDRPPRHARRGRALTLTGTVAPRKRVVHVVLQQRVRGRWRKVGSRAVRARRGRFTTSFVPAFRASYRYYAVVKSDDDTDRGSSGPSAPLAPGALTHQPCFRSSL